MNKLSNAAVERRIKPLLKWPGGKRALLNSIIPLLPKDFGCYYEPFLGGGALFFALHPREAVLADHNIDLIECYIEVRNRPQQVIAHLATMPNSQEDYYRIRQWQPTTASERSARLIYLVTLSFNGIYRENLNGQFNVPYGQKDHLVPCQADRIHEVSKALLPAILRYGDFEMAVSDATRGDLVYFDPPYTVMHSNNGFLKYNAHIFSWRDQVRLRNLALSLADRGCYVLVSNANHSSLVDLYKDFNVQVVTRPSRIAALGEYRGPVTECLFYKGFSI